MCCFLWQAESLVLALRDLFQVVFEIKKKEMAEVKKLKSENEDNEKQSKAEKPDVTSQPQVRAYNYIQFCFVILS